MPPLPKFPSSANQGNLRPKDFHSKSFFQNYNNLKKIQFPATVLRSVWLTTNTIHFIHVWGMTTVRSPGTMVRKEQMEETNERQGRKTNRERTERAKTSCFFFFFNKETRRLGRVSLDF